VRGGPPPWETPELTGVGRVPMHSVPHHDRVALDGRWRFQLLPSPDAEPDAAWGEIEVPGCWTMQGWGDLPHYTNVVMPFRRRSRPRTRPASTSVTSSFRPGGPAGGSSSTSAPPRAC
jgi:beta-galactosidase/beta-glucuronidase